MSDNDFESRQFPTQGNRDYSLPTNQRFPRSLRSSGMELDEVCGERVEQSGMDAFFQKEYATKEIR